MSVVLHSHSLSFAISILYVLFSWRLQVFNATNYSYCQTTNPKAFHFFNLSSSPAGKIIDCEIPKDKSYYILIPIFQGQRATGFFSLQDCTAFFGEQFQYLLFSVFHFPIQIAHFESSMQMWRKSPEKISTYCRKTPLNFNSFGISNIKTPST